MKTRSVPVIIIREDGGTMGAVLNNAERDRAAESCILALGKGDKSALGELYLLAATPVYSYALSVLGNRHDAEDVLQDCMVRIWTAAPSYAPRDKPFAWMIRIARNLCVDVIRERKRVSPVEALPESLAPSEDPVSCAEDRLLLECFLNGLSAEERQVVVLHAVAGLKFRETAQTLGIPPPTAMTRYRRAIAKLKKKFDEEV